MAFKCVRFNDATGVFEWYEYPTAGSAAWGSVGGTLANQVDLQGELDAKAEAADLASHEGAADPHPNYALDSDLSDHAGAADPHTAYQRESEKGAASGYAGLDGSSKLSGAQQVYGTGVNTACEGNDARLSDARTPTSHATSHKSGGGDAIKLDELAAPTDVTTLNASATAHGLLPKWPNNTTTFLRGDGTYAAPTATAAWGSITGTLSAQTDLQTALDGKAASLGGDDNYVTDAEKTIIGNTSGTNTGDNATNTQYSGLAASKQDTLVSATNIKTVNGVTLLGSGNLAVATVTAGVGTSPTSSSTQQITHNLGRTPIVIRIHGRDTFLANAAALPPTGSTGLWCSTGNLCVYQPYDAATITAAEPAATNATYAIRQQTGVGNFATGVIGNVGATTFDIVWTETGTHTAQVYLWEAS